MIRSGVTCKLGAWENADVTAIAEYVPTLHAAGEQR